MLSRSKCTIIGDKGHINKLNPLNFRLETNSFLRADVNFITLILLSTENANEPISGISVNFRARDANLEISIWKFVAGANQGNRCLSKHELSTEDDGDPNLRDLRQLPC